MMQAFSMKRTDFATPRNARYRETRPPSHYPLSSRPVRVTHS